jgi:predicted enzyme related to lactoylglutathione lyase
MLNGMTQIVWWEIETTEPDVFQRFHHALWGWTFESAFADTELDADYWIIRSGRDGIGGLQRSASSARPHVGTRLYVEVADLEATLHRVQDIGGRVERGRTALGGDDRWFATALDPTGISFGMWTANAAA